MKVALCVGHSRKIKGRTEGGAVSVDGTNEWEFNSRLAELIADELEILGVEVRIWSEYRGSSYGSAMTWLAEEIEDWKADCAIELHFNSATPGASGHEWLYWHTSDRGMLLAAEFNKFMMDSFPEIRQRGIKPIKHKERGSGFLRLTHCPAVVTEPFFGSNDGEWGLINSDFEELATIHADAIYEWGVSEGLFT